MRHIKDDEEYYRVVEALAEEFTSEIERGETRSLANCLIAAFEVHDRKPVVLSALEFDGAPIESIDSCLNPYEVLLYSRADRLSSEEERSNTRDVAAERAAEALAIDLRDASES